MKQKGPHIVKQLLHDCNNVPCSRCAQDGLLSPCQVFQRPQGAVHLTNRPFTSHRRCTISVRLQCQVPLQVLSGQGQQPLAGSSSSGCQWLCSILQAACVTHLISGCTACNKVVEATLDDLKWGGRQPSLMYLKNFFLQQEI